MVKSTQYKKWLRDSLDPNPLYGFELAQSTDLILLARENDFFLDGCQIIRKCDVDKAVRTASTRHCFRILKAEGLVDSLQIPAVNLSSWKTVFRSLGLGTTVWVENEKTGDFTIGPILRINAKSVRADYFDGAGTFSGPQTFRFEAITTIQFGTRYLELHTKHLKTR
ncbi:MAG: hypothetical protein AAGK14_06390 [Verrucomicrobiota bacterium]